jgi:hypothetical protein
MSAGRLALCFLVCSIATAASAHAQTVGDAEAFLRSVYAPYRADGKPIDLTGPQAEKILDPSLVALLREDQAAVQGEVGVLDGDPICACQDFDIRSIQASVRPDGDGKATAIVRFKNFGRAKVTEVRFDLVAIKGAWRIFDIHEKEIPSLREALEEEIAAIRSESSADGGAPADDAKARSGAARH